MKSHGQVAASVAQEKERHPERFCKEPKCLWRVATRNGSNPCKKHPQPQHD